MGEAASDDKADGGDVKGGHGVFRSASAGIGVTPNDMVAFSGATSTVRNAYKIHDLVGSYRHLGRKLTKSVG